MDPLFFKLVRVVNLTARPFQESVGRQHQLTLNEWRVLSLLGAEPGLTATQVAELTGMDKMGASRAIAGLSRRRRLQRREDPADQRRSRLYLTSAGKALCSTVGELAKAREAALFARVKPADLGRLDGILDSLLASVAADGQAGA
jgi:DNA-binding MarR family transcriptional regulator